MPAVEVSELVDGVRTILLNRPEALNTINDELTRDFLSALDVVEADEDCRVVVLTGAGRAFCAGLDLSGYGDDDLIEAQGKVRRFVTRQAHIATISTRLHHLRQPVIAAINGAAAGGGLSFTLACDIRIATTNTVFAAAFIRAGFTGCDMGASWLLPRIVGTGRAHELLLTGRKFFADEALSIGMLSAVVAPEELADVVRQKCDEILLNAPLSVDLTKEGMWAALDIPSFDAMIRFENRQQVIAALTEDQGEAADAFLEKRLPNYQYR